MTDLAHPRRAAARPDADDPVGSIWILASIGEDRSGAVRTFERGSSRTQDELRFEIRTHHLTSPDAGPAGSAP